MISCPHYNRNCSFIAPCCNKIYGCRHCHDDIEANIIENNIIDHNEIKNKPKSHMLDRTSIKEIVCNLCETKQNVSNLCINCNTIFGAYHCSKCNFYDNNIEKNYYHCDDCGICRVGGENNFFHCVDCGCCLSIKIKDEHVCRKELLKQECPVCLENLFLSTKSSIILNCNHTMHVDCYESYIKSGSLNCPICRKSIMMKEFEQIYNESLDAEIAATPIPNEITGNKIKISCNDCESISELFFHPFGLKCSNCGCYNTKRI
jgi:RING finger/CHY zinc finger protein 1